MLNSQEQHSKFLIKPLIGMFLFYLICVAGGIFSYLPDDAAKSVIKAFLLIFSVAYFCIINKSVKIPRRIIIFSSLCAPILLISAMRSSYPGYAFEKIDGALISSTLLAMIFVGLHKQLGEKKIEALFICVSFFILILTIAFKLKYGFNDRTVRFFLNGPIVYGWIVALAALFSFSKWVDTRKVYYIILFFAFCLSIIWTESKGPLLAFSVALIMYIGGLAKDKPKLVMMLLTIFLVVILVTYPFLQSWLDGTRFEAIAHIVDWSFNDNDQGSVGDRIELFRYAKSIIWANPVFGIGLGNFKFGDYVYPHNIHLEIFVELGALVGIIHVMFTAYSYFKSALIYRAVIILFVLCGCFSGDISYLRFLYCFCLVGIVLGRKINGQNVDAWI